MTQGASILTIAVQFGDCDPAGIVFFPNFARWMDAASLQYFRSHGVAPWRDWERSHGILGTPVLETHTRFVLPATYGETITVHTTVERWERKVFHHRHEVRRGDTLLCEGTEVRAFVARDETGRMRAVPIPESIRTSCGAPPA